ncbi:hypothetical protein R3P38DRAFT_2565894, partial [Favolaschia claudopus]
TLPRQYSGLIRTLNNTPVADRTLDRVETDILIEDGTVRGIEGGGVGQTTVAAGYGNSGALAAQANADVTCENCGGAGHTKARCWHKGGDIEGQYPDWWIGKREASKALVLRSHMAYDVTSIVL